MSDDDCYCECCPKDVMFAYYYWYDEIFYSDKITPKKICEQIDHKGVANLILRYFNFGHLYQEEGELLTKQIIEKIKEGVEIVDWMFKNVTNMLGDIYLILTLLEKEKYLIHKCTFESNKRKYCSCFCKELYSWETKNIIIL